MASDTSSLENINQTYSAYTDSFTSQLDAVEASRENFFTESSFDAEEFEDLFKRYAPYAKLEDMPSTVRAFYQQETYVEQVDLLCDKMEGVSASHSQNANQRNSVIPNARAEIEAAVTRDQIAYFDARGNFLDDVSISYSSLTFH